MAKRFIPPTLDEIKAYAMGLEKFDIDAFIDHYEMSGWKMSNGNKLVSWQAAVRMWIRRQHDFKPKAAQLEAIRPKPCDQSTYRKAGSIDEGGKPMTEQEREEVYGKLGLKGMIGNAAARMQMPN